MTGNVVVIGSLNQDLVATVPRIPTPGETVLASGHQVHPGGKGANQATAAARLGAKVAMVGRVGDDAAGRSLIAGLHADGVDTAHVSVDPSAATGLALITVDDGGENAIAVSPGANGRVAPDDVAAAAGMIAAADVVLMQLEVPLDALAAAVAVARGTLVLNPAPAAVLPAELLSRIDVIIPNQSELALLAGTSLQQGADIVAAARALPVDDVVVTLGGSGAMIVTRTAATRVPARPGTAVDTTGAGDAVRGAVAAELSRGSYLEAAVRFAVRVAAIAVTRHGAQPSMPRRDEL